MEGRWTAGSRRRRPRASASTKLTHFRIRGVNAVLLHDARDGVKQGSTFEATVPMNPFDVMSKADKTCADYDNHISLDQSVYWYLWNPEKSGCTLPTQKLKLTVSKMFASPKKTYPEYDRLVADGKVTAVVLFGQIDDGPVKNSDPGMSSLKQMADWLRQGGFKEVTPAPVGRRFTKHIGSVDFEVDLYSPFDFAGLDDDAHFANFQKALSEHEIVTYDGHSMLGRQRFLGAARPTRRATRSSSTVAASVTSTTCARSWTGRAAGRTSIFSPAWSRSRAAPRVRRARLGAHRLVAQPQEQELLAEHPQLGAQRGRRQHLRPQRRARQLLVTERLGLQVT